MVLTAEIAAAELLADADALAAQTRAANTRRGYGADWRHFAAWCAQKGVPPLPGEPESVRLYLAAYGMPGKPEMLTASTLERHLAAITAEHRANGHEPPTHTDAVRKVLAGIRRAQAREGIVPVQTRPLVLADLHTVIRALPLDSHALWPQRNRAILLLGFAAALRRSEIAALNVADIEIVEDKGLVVSIRSSKTDQKGEGEQLAVGFGREEDVCPVRSYIAWLETSGIARGPLFRPIDRHGRMGEKRLSAWSINEVVKTSVRWAGFDPDQYTGHAMRAGLATSAAEAGVDRKIIARTTRHKSMVVLDKYIRQASLFDQTAAQRAGM